jgi:iron complex outermembrane receptor protein
VATRSAPGLARVCLLLGAGLAACTPAVAQVGTGALPRLPPVVATATRSAADPLDVPAAIDVIAGADIQRAQARINLSESLQRVPGVVARDRQNFAQDQQISIRGFGARASFGVRGVRLYSDGIPASMPDGQGQAAHFPLDSAARIEVLRGPFSARYGNSSGGVFALFTADAPAAPVVKGDLVLGAYGLRRAAWSAQAPWGADQDGSLLLDLVDLHSEGYRRHGAARRRSGQLTVKGGFGNGVRYTVLANGLDLAADDPQGLSGLELLGDRRAAGRGAIAFDTRKTVRQTQLGGHFEQQLSDRQSWSLTPYAGQRQTRQMLSVPVAVQAASALHGGGAIALDRAYDGLDARWRWTGQLRGQPLALTVGTAREVSDERRRGFENFLGSRLGVFGALRRDQRDRVRSQDYYLQADWQPAPRWRVNAGLRRSDVRFVSRDDFITAGNPDDSGRLAYAHTAPVLGLLFHARPWLSLYANAGSGFETPTFAELA